MELWYGGETWRDFIRGTVDGDNQNADPNSTCGVLQNAENGFYICPAHDFSTCVTPYVQDVPDIWGFGSRNMTSWTRNFPLTREAPYPKPAWLPTYQ
jgi:hypothetical protein